MYEKNIFLSIQTCITITSKPDRWVQYKLISKRYELIYRDAIISHTKKIDTIVPKTYFVTRIFII